MQRQEDFDAFYGPSRDRARALAGFRVLIVGLGATGSHVARELAYMGFSLVLVDSDALSTSNLHRHILPRAYVGWNKAVGVADHLERELPLPQEFTAERTDIVEAPLETIVRFVSDVDLVIAATGNNAADRVLNRVCRELGIPILVPQIFPEDTVLPDVGVSIGRIHVVPYAPNRPRDWQLGCIECVPLAEGESSSGQALEAQPGLVSDVGCVAQFTSHLAVALLTPQSDEGRVVEQIVRRGENFFVIPKLSPRLASMPSERRPGCAGCEAPHQNDSRVRATTPVRQGLDPDAAELAVRIAVVPTAIAEALVKFRVIKGIDLSSVALMGVLFWAVNYVCIQRMRRIRRARRARTVRREPGFFRFFAYRLGLKLAWVAVLLGGYRIHEDILIRKLSYYPDPLLYYGALSLGFWLIVFVTGEAFRLRRRAT